MDPPSDSYRLKLNWAKKHFELLNGEISRFLDAEPYGAEVREFDSESQSFIIRSVVKTELPRGWPLVIGDCVHNLRSALDHLAWQLATDRATGLAPKGTEFPVFLERDKYKKLDRSGRPAPGSGAFKVRGMSAAAQAAIEGLQPYNRSDGVPELHPLWLLQALSNEDKHRVLSVVGTIMEESEITFRQPPVDADLEMSFDYGVPLEPETRIGQLRFQPRGPQATVNFEVEGTFFVAFGKEGAGRGLRVPDTLADIANFITLDVLPALEPFLASGTGAARDTSIPAG